MENTMKLLLGLLLAVTSNSFASVTIEDVNQRQSLLWSTPAPSRFLIDVTPVEGLVESCQQFEMIAKRVEQMSSSASAQRVYEQAIKTPVSYQFPDDLFPHFIIEVPSESNWVFELDNQQDQNKVDPVPYYFQSRSIVNAWPDSIRDYPLFTQGRGPLTLLSEKLGISSPEWSIRRLGPTSYSLEIAAKDRACDFLNGHLNVYTQMDTWITPETQGMRQLNEFYNEKLLPDLLELMSFRGTDEQKAPLFGYIYGNLIQNYSLDVLGEEMSLNQIFHHINITLLTFFEANSFIAKPPFLYKPEGESRIELETALHEKVSTQFKVVQ
jgi:hypothetical protein